MHAYLHDFLPCLRCPLSSQELREMNKEELNKLNTSIALNKIFTQEGEPVSEPLEEAVVSADGAYVYRILDGYIAAMLPEQAISTKGVVPEGVAKQDEVKKKVKEFYDDYGWKKSDGENYNDTVTFEDRRPVSKKYWSQCHLRLNKHLGEGGDYLLDVASGAIPNDEYLTYSNKFKLRVCMDFSIEAVRGAAERLNGKGIFILGDMTHIPLADHSIDAVISMHTVYHVPLAEQTRAVAESYRVLKPGKNAVIVYNWKEPGLMKMVFGVWRPLLRFYQTVRGRGNKNKKANQQTAARTDLLIQKQDYDWFSKQIKKQYNARLSVYSAISRSFSLTFLREKWLGRQVSSIIYRLESMFPSFLGRWGQYPVFVLRKPRQSAARQSAARQAAA